MNRELVPNFELADVFLSREKKHKSGGKLTFLSCFSLLPAARKPLRKGPRENLANLRAGKASMQLAFRK